MLFSATMVGDVKKLAGRCTYYPTEISVGKRGGPPRRLEHSVFPVSQSNRFPLLLALLKKFKDGSVLIFTRTRSGARDLERMLDRRGIRAAVLHAEKTQEERDRHMAAFREGRVRLMVATSLAARGIDLDVVKYVINYEPPDDPEDYVHRIGRTARAGEIGRAATLITPAEVRKLKRIEKFVGQEIHQEKLEGFDYRGDPVKSMDKKTSGLKSSRRRKGPRR
jgi:ATP-dependent RNA helicase RhlE